MSYPWTHDDTFMFLEQYQGEEILWNPRHKYYKDRQRIKEAWKRVSDILKIPIIELKKKKETLMTAFRAHYKKKQTSIRLSLDEDDIYKPVWPYYDIMESFLNCVYERKLFGTQELQDDNASLSNEEAENACTDDNEEPVIIIPVQKKRTHKPIDMENAEKHLYGAFNTLINNLLKERQTSMEHKHNEDDCDLYGRLLAKRLRKYCEDERQEIMNEIDSMLLNRHRNYD